MLTGEAVAEGGKALSGAIVDDQDYIGAFSFAHDDGQQAVDAWSNVIQDDAGQPVFRMLDISWVALVESCRIEPARIRRNHDGTIGGEQYVAVDSVMSAPERAGVRATHHELES